MPLLFKRKRIDPHAHRGAFPTCTTSQHSRSFLLFSPPIKKKKKKPCKHRLDCAVKIQSWEDHQRSQRPFGGLVYSVLFPPPPPPRSVGITRFLLSSRGPPHWCVWNEKVQQTGMKILNQVAQRGGQCRGDFCDNEAPWRIIEPLCFFFM